MQKLYILDASGYLYRSYFAIRNITNAKGESTNALFGFIRSVQKLFKDFQPDHLVAVFDGPKSIQARGTIYSGYKAHRAAMPPDLRYQIEWAQQFCELIGIPFLSIPEVEADDTMGSIAKWAAANKKTFVYLCTSDKDLCQMVNEQIFILNTHKENQILGPKEVKELYGIPPELMVDYLAITGDTSDNIPGIPGFGPKTAVALLKQFGSLDAILNHASDLPQKKQAILDENIENVKISRQLVQIHTDVEFPKNSSFFKLEPPKDIGKLKEFYASMNFNSLLKELELSEINKRGIAEQENELLYHLVNDENEFEELMSYLEKQPEICFDTETTDVQPIKAELVGIGFGVEPQKAWYVPVNGKLSLDYLLKSFKKLFENPHIAFYGHNVKYDMQVLANYGIEVKNIGFDTMIASYLLNSHSRQHSLDILSLEYFGKVKIDIKDLIGKGKQVISMSKVPLPKICTYCCEDVDYTCRLKQILQQQLIDRKLDHLLKEIELPLLSVLAQMERHGIYLDIPCLKEFSTEIASLIKDLEKEIFSLAETKFNLNSPKQLLDVLKKMGIPLSKKTATGLSTNAGVLEGLKNNYPIAGIILEYRGLEKLRSTYVETLPFEVNPKTARIHCTFNQSVAATGRLSCQNPNLQNIPVRTEVGRRIREAFRPEKKDWSFLSADYSQVELRLLAHLSEDPHLIKAFKENQDIHTHTAAAIFNIPIDQVSKEMRHRAKAVNFGVIYGQQAFGLAQELNISRKEAEVFIEMYFKQYKRVKEFIEFCKEKVRQEGKAVSATGRERAIPEINSKNSHLRALAERLAVNSPIQGTAADLIKMAMLNIDDLLHQKKKKAFMVLQIHDELIFELPDQEIETVKSLVREGMEGVMKLKVPLIVDINIGKNWKEC